MTRGPVRWWCRRGLRFRITLAATTIALVPLFGLAVAAGNALGPLLVASVDAELERTLARAGAAVADGKAPARSAGPSVRVLDTAGGPVDGAPPPRLDRDDVRALTAGLPVTVEPAGAEPGTPAWRWLGSVVTAPDGAQRLVAVGTPMTGFAATVADGSRLLLLLAVPGALVATGATWLAVRAALAPVDRMRGELSRLPPGRRLALPRADDELRALAAEVNVLLADREAAAERLRRFTGDAAHELRSPVAAIRMETEVALAASRPGPDTGPDAEADAWPDAEVARETLEDVLAEAERLTTLLDSLLALARSDAGELPPAEPVELVTQIREAVARVPADGPSVRASPAVPSAWASGHPAETELVLDNLLRNARAHAASQVVVSVLVSRAFVRVVVDDDGPGVPPEHRARVFDRFYRVAGDRSRASGGTGLGLAMVAEVVRRRGGRFSVGDSPDGGARFQVSWRRHG